jgi:hypothetical protein
MEPSNKITIFESTSCCSGGNCCPSLDKSTIGLQDALDNIKKFGVVVERYSIAQNLKRFMENSQVIKLIKEQHIGVLPITMLNGDVIKTGSYPSEKELQELIK